jgi:hypothetical protein
VKLIGPCYPRDWIWALEFARAGNGAATPSSSLNCFRIEDGISTQSDRCAPVDLFPREWMTTNWITLRLIILL